MKCPMDSTELTEIGGLGKNVFEACSKCGREWYYLGENLASRPRKVMLVRPIESGAHLDDCIKPVDSDN